MSIGTEDQHVTLRPLGRNIRNSLRVERLVRNKCYRRNTREYGWKPEGQKPLEYVRVRVE
jgi:hypothetical protein